MEPNKIVEMFAQLGAVGILAAIVTILPKMIRELREERRQTIQMIMEQQERYVRELHDKSDECKEERAALAEHFRAERTTFITALAELKQEVRDAATQIVSRVGKR